MNKIQGCVYIVRKTPLVPKAQRNDRISWGEYFRQCDEIRKTSAPFCKAATQYRAGSQNLKVKPYAYRSITDDDNGVRELIDEYMGNGSVVLFDLRGLPNIAKSLLSMIPDEYIDSVHLFENDTFHSLRQCQAVELAEVMQEHAPMPLIPI